ncbi:YbaB/EbfC family nucleoid-associated protein [Micromonospora sp. URMC 103]|uniref:YbaB/EbfC family nucleoid-associated protein n=1 Tax=Micromonospora sp. URMC 103 TaxID=3423406 RepID=UPI003F1AAED8
MADFDGTQVGQLLAQMRQTLDTMRAGPQEAGAPREDAVGEAADGQVRAVMRDGRLESVRLDPRVMRLASDDLGEHIVTAVNAALAAARQPTAGVPVTVDPARLAEQLREVQDASVRQMSMFGQAMNDVLARMRESGGGR